MIKKWDTGNIVVKKVLEIVENESRHDKNGRDCGPARLDLRLKILF